MHISFMSLYWYLFHAGPCRINHWLYFICVLVCVYERYHSFLLILMIFFLFIITDSTMVRNYIRKTDKGRVPGEILKRAYELIESTNKSVRSAAEQFNIPRSTLRDYIKRCKDGNESSGYPKPHQFVNAQQEEELVQYLQHASSIYLLWINTPRM